MSLILPVNPDRVVMYETNGWNNAGVDKCALMIDFVYKYDPATGSHDLFRLGDMVLSSFDAGGSLRVYFNSSGSYKAKLLHGLQENTRYRIFVVSDMAALTWSVYVNGVSNPGTYSAGSSYYANANVIGILIGSTEFDVDIKQFATWSGSLPTAGELAGGDITTALDYYDFEGGTLASSTSGNSFFQNSGGASHILQGIVESVKGYGRSIARSIGRLIG